MPSRTEVTVNQAEVVSTLSSLLTQLQEINVNTTAIDLSTDGVEALLQDIDDNTDGLEGVNTDIRNRLLNIESDADANRVAVQAIETILNAHTLLIDDMETMTLSIRNSNTNIETDVDAIRVDMIALEVLANTAEAARTAINAELDSIDDNWNLLSTNQLNLAAILAAVLNNSTSGRQDTAQTSFDTMLTDNDAIITDLAAIEVTLAALEVLQTALVAGTNTHSLNWHLDFVVDGGGAGTVIIELIVPAGQKLWDVWVSCRMSIQTSTETVTIQHVVSSDNRVKRQIGTGTFSDTTTIFHWPRESANDAPTEFNMAAGEALLFTFSSLTAADRFLLQVGGDLRDSTAFAASTKTGTATITINQEDHEEIA